MCYANFTFYKAIDNGIEYFFQGRELIRQPPVGEGRVNKAKSVLRFEKMQKALSIQVKLNAQRFSLDAMPYYFHPPPKARYKLTTACNCCSLSLTPLNCAANKLCSEVSTSV